MCLLSMTDSLNLPVLLHFSYRHASKRFSWKSAFHYPHFVNQARYKRFLR